MKTLIKIPKAWTPSIRALAQEYNELRDKHNPEQLKPLVERLLSILRDGTLDARERVMVTFLLEEIDLNGFVEWLGDAIVDSIAKEENANVVEFVVYMLARLLLREKSLPLITKYLPFFTDLARESNANVASFVQDFQGDVEELRAQQEMEREKVEKELSSFSRLVENSIQKMVAEADEISKAALALDYEQAALKREKMERTIRDFSKHNEKLEAKIRDTRETIAVNYLSFRQTSAEIVDRWRKERSERETLIRKVHCILRIQSKIFLIISYIMKKKDGQLSEEDFRAIKDQTNYSEDDVLNILEKLVEEEVLPNFFPTNKEESDQ